MRLPAGLAAPQEGIVNIRLGEGSFHIAITAAGPSCGHGLVEHPHVQLTVDGQAYAELTQGDADLPARIGSRTWSASKATARWRKPFAASRHPDSGADAPEQ